TRAIAHTLGALLTVSLYAEAAPAWLLGGWLAALAAAVWLAARIDRGLANVDRRPMTREEYRRQALGVAGCGAGWAAAPVGFVPYASVAEAPALGAPVATLIA